MGQQISDRHNLSRQMKVNEDGSIDVNAELEVKDIQIGAVEIKDGTTDIRAIVNSDGSINNTQVVVVYGTRIDEATSTVTYIGKATPGTATSVSLWQIQKIDTTTGTVITWADGNGDFDNEWDNRTSLSYS